MKNRRTKLYIIGLNHVSKNNGDKMNRDEMRLLEITKTLQLLSSKDNLSKDEKELMDLLTKEKLEILKTVGAI